MSIDIEQITEISGGVTAAQGFMASSCEAGIKYQNRKDMALVYSEKPAVVGGTFTTNVVKASPVYWDMDLVKNEPVSQAVVLNSGIANAVTGTVGDELNEAMAEAVAKALGLSTRQVLTASTGVIGMQLVKEKFEKGALLLKQNLSDTIQAGTGAAEAIMTTDTVSKEAAVEIILDGKKVTIGGMSKGSGMIHPNMATMLSVVTTDAAISKELLQKAVSENVADSFNMISVDRDTSTNDTFLALANGAAGNAEITSENEDYALFKAALLQVMTKLAKTMAADGEGATKLLEMTVLHAATKEEAKSLAKSVITSNLVKTAVYGSDANWGRIFCAMGYAGVEFDPDMVDLYIESTAGKLKLVENGMATDYSEETATEILAQSAVTATADMKAGEACATAWGCDLTYDYVKINGDYRT